MKIMKIFIFFCCFTLVFFFISLAVAQSISISPFTLKYHRFLVADLGFTGGGRPNRIFKVDFETAEVVGDLYYLHITVFRDSDGKILGSGDTGSYPYNEKFSGKSYYNYELEDELSGDFKISDEAGDLKDKVLATSAFPEGTFTIKVDLIPVSSGPGPFDVTITVIIDHPYMRTIYPVDTSVTPSSMKFIWQSNLEDQEFRLYTDPRGRNEITKGTRLPRRGVRQSLDGGSFDSFLDIGELYFWQVNGYMNTSHGRVLTKGPISMFLFLEEGSSVMELGLSEAEKAAILEELTDILRDLVNKRAARSIRGYDFERILLDNSIITVKELMAILSLIKSGDVQVNRIYFR